MNYNIYKSRSKCFNCGKSNILLVGQPSNSSIHKVYCKECDYNIGEYDWEEWLVFKHLFDLEII